jgi:endogenous inhibitor of DNA gyrase (YacG/DUF329 family)
MNTTFPCPTCQRPLVWSTGNSWRPFCSERCKMIDLGAWVSESYSIAEAITEDDFNNDPFSST